MVIVVPYTEEKRPVEVARQAEEIPSSDQNPPPYSPLPRGEGSSLHVATLPSPPPNLSATNYLHVIEKNDTIKQNVLIDLSLPPSQASTLLTGTQDSEVSHFILDSHNGTANIEVWVHRSDHGNTAAGDNKGMKERARLAFRTHNGTIKARVHIHPSITEPRPLLQIEARGHNGSVELSIPRSFRGQLTLHTHNGRVTLSSALAPHAAMLSGVNGAHTYFIGERPGDDRWRTGTGGEGEEVDEAIGWSNNGTIKVSYDDEGGARTPGVLSTLFRAMGF